MTRRLAALAACLLLGACVPSDGPTMRPGQDCMRCHRAGGEREAPTFTAAGTVYVNPVDPAGAGVSGIQVSLTDATGRTVRLKTNGAGNFYTRERLSLPFRARLEGRGVTREMQHDVPASSGGSCNLCHALPPGNAGDVALTAPGRVALVGGALDELMLPGFDCLSCHDGTIASRRFAAAGTVFTNTNDPFTAGVAGVAVTLTDASGAVIALTTNAAGNFFTDGPLAFPVTTRIDRGADGRAMTHALPHGACNKCHALPPTGDAGVPAPLGRVALVGGTGSPTMNPGDDCRSCHDGVSARNFTAAGTVYPSASSPANAGIAGVTVRLIDGSGAVAKQLVSNEAGNFFTEDALPGAVRIEIQQGATTRSMEATSTPASCNRCHRPGGETGRVGLVGGGD